MMSTLDTVFWALWKVQEREKFEINSHTLSSYRPSPVAFYVRGHVTLPRVSVRFSPPLPPSPSLCVGAHASCTERPPFYLLWGGGESGAKSGEGRGKGMEPQLELLLLIWIPWNNQKNIPGSGVQRKIVYFCPLQCCSKNMQKQVFLRPRSIVFQHSQQNKSWINIKKKITPVSQIPRRIMQFIYYFRNWRVFFVLRSQTFITDKFAKKNSADNISIGIESL